MKFRKKQTEKNTRSPRYQAQRSAPVFSYYSSRSGAEAAATARKSVPSQHKASAVRVGSDAWWLRYLPSLVSLAVVFGSAFYLTTLSTSPKVEVVRTDDQNAVLLQESEVYRRAAQDILSGSIFNRSKLTLDADKTAGQITEQFPELGEAVIAIPLFGRKPILEIQPVQPVLLLSSRNGVFVIDTDGKAVLQADRLNSSVRDTLPVVTDEAGIEVSLNSQVLPSDTISFIASLSRQFKAKNIKIDEFTLPTIANEVHVKPAGESYIVKFNTESDARLQAGSYFALSDRLENEPADVKEYVDVRVEERVYYR